MAVATATTGALIYLCLEVGDGGHEGLHLFHHRLVLSGGGGDADELLLEVVLGDLLGSLGSCRRRREGGFVVTGRRGGDAAHDFVDDGGIRECRWL